MERISGNSGNDEKYVVIAKNGNVALGLYLKAMRDHYRDGEPYTIHGRLRAAAAPGCEATALEVNDAFEGLPFEKFASDEFEGAVIRASLTVLIFTTQQDRQGIPQAVAALKVGHRVTEFLLKSIDEKLLTMTPDKLTEVIADEVTTQSLDKLSGLLLAQKIANTDEGFMVSVTSVCEILNESLDKARDAYEATVAKAKEVADIASKVLIAEHQKSNPDFTFYIEEKVEQDFGLASLAYGETEISEDDGYIT